jgi:hypothetical protein
MIPKVWMVRGVLVTVFAVCWVGLERRNAAMREGQRVMTARARMIGDVRVLRASVRQFESQIPGPGRGDPSWWRDRLSTEASRCRLTWLRFESKPSDLTLGPHGVLRREVVVEGAFDALRRYMAWLEASSPRLRLERFAIESSPPASVRATLVVLLPSPNR